MTRRELLAGFSLIAVALAAGLMPETAKAAQVNVDVRPLRAQFGPGGASEILRQRIQQGMARAFAGRPGVITVRLYTLSLAAATYSSYGGSGTDYLEGEIIVGGRSVPLLVTQNADSAGYWRSPDFNSKRVASLADAFVGWAQRKI